jgi:DNA-binding winged helix-turn-helix (wHTH) protein/TolB-like protein/Tfp pilus assembly protein PilF
MALAVRRLFRFGPFRLDVDRRLLLRGSEIVPLRPRVFDTLVVLAERAGDVVSKEELLDAVWPDTVVEENNLSQNVLALRRALETDGSVRIETVPRRGFRLIADLEEELAPPRPALPAERPTGPTVSAGASSRPSRRPRIAAAIVAATLALAVSAIVWMRRASSPSPEVRSIAVLPMRTLGSSSADEYLGLGLADAVTTRLGYVRRLLVRPTGSVSALGGASDPLAAGRRLGVDAVLAGQIQRSDGRVRVTAQLVGIRNGGEIWSETFDVKEADLFTLEDSVSEAVARALVTSLSPGEKQRLGRDRPTSPEAYEAYLQGRYFWNQRSETGTRQARVLFEKAIALDPRYALAYAGLADALHYFPQGDDLAHSREIALQALALDDSLAEAHASLGNLSLFTDWNFDDAERRFRRALDLNPSYATAHQWYAYCFLVRGDLAGAAREIRRAREADPLSPSIAVDEALMLYYSRRYDEALDAFRRVLDLDPNFGQALQYVPIIQIQRGDLEAAERACTELSRVQSLSGPPLAEHCGALLAAHRGDRGAAESVLAGLTGRYRWMTVAQVAIALGDRGGTFAALEEGYRQRDATMLLLGADPLFESLRGDPRFEDLLRRIGIRPLSG